MAPEKWWLEDYFPIGKVTFQGRTVKLLEGKTMLNIEVNKEENLKFIESRNAWVHCGGDFRQHANDHKEAMRGVKIPA